jgi:hypothetical protein
MADALAVAGAAGLELLPLDSQGRVTDGGQRLSRRVPVQAAVSADGVLATASSTGVVEVYRRRDKVWTTTVVPGHEGYVIGLAIHGHYLVSAGRDTNIRIYDLQQETPVVDDDQGVNVLPTALWTDRHGIVVSSDLSRASLDLVLDPAEAVRRACALGGWDYLRPRIGDIHPSAPATVADVRLCQT